MPDYLSPEWFDAASTLVAGSTALAARTSGVNLVLEQTVEDAVDPEADPIVWHIDFNDGAVALEVGAAPAADVTFRCDRETAEGIRSGTLSAQVAFMTGQLRIGGSVSALIENGELFAALDDVLAPLR